MTQSKSLQRWGKAGILVILAITLIVILFETTLSSASHAHAHTTRPADLLLSRSQIIAQSTLSVDLTRGIGTFPLHQGNFHGQTVWYIITDSSDYGFAEALGLLFAPKLENVAAGCPSCVQDVTLTVRPDTTFNEAIVNFQGIPDFRPTRSLVAGPHGFPPARFQPGSVGDAKYSPLIRIQGSTAVYNAPIVAVGNGPFDLVHHSNTHDRVVGIDLVHRTVDLLLVHGFDSGQPILYLSTDSNNPLAATLERSTYVPALANIAFMGGDDFLGSARERIFGFTNGQVGKNNPQAQGLSNLILTGNAALDATPTNTGIGKPLGNAQADALNTQGDFPTIKDPVHSATYSPLWDLQLGEWTPAAIAQGLNTRQNDENQILDLAAKGLVTGPGGAPYGSVDIVINCPPIAFLKDRPTGDLVPPGPNQPGVPPGPVGID